MIVTEMLEAVLSPLHDCYPFSGPWFVGWEGDSSFVGSYSLCQDLLWHQAAHVGMGGVIDCQWYKQTRFQTPSGTVLHKASVHKVTEIQSHCITSTPYGWHVSVQIFWSELWAVVLVWYKSFKNAHETTKLYFFIVCRCLFLRLSHDSKCSCRVSIHDKSSVRKINWVRCSSLYHDLCLAPSCMCGKCEKHDKERLDEPAEFW